VIPNTNPAKEHLQNLPTKFRQKGFENHLKENWEEHQEHLGITSNLLYISWKIHTRSSLPPHHPSHSQDLTMKLSS
jgi:hypothetical protein